VKTLKLGESTQEAYRMVFETAIDASVFAGFELERVNDTTLVARSSGKNVRQELLKVISEKELPLASITKSDEQSLEDVFRKLTQSKTD